MSLEVKPGQQIKASQFNALAASVSQSIGATDTPFRSTGQGMIVNGGNAPYQSKAKYQNDRLFECRIGSGKVPDKFVMAGQDFYGTFVNVANFLNTSVYSAQRIDPRSTPTVVQLAEVLYIQDPTAGEGQVQLVGFEVASSNKTPAEVGFSDFSNIWCPVSQMKWDEKKKYFVGGSVYLRMIQLFSWGEPGTHGIVVMIIDDGSISSAEDLKAAIIAATGYNPVAQIDQMRPLRQIQLFSTRTAITDANDKPLAAPVQFFDGTFTVGNDPDADISNVSYLQSIEKTDIAQLGLSGYAGEIRGSHCYSLYHFGQLSPDFSYPIPWEDQTLSSFDVLVKAKKPHPHDDDVATEGRAEASLVYFSLGSFAPPPPDSVVPATMLSSIQWTEVLDEDSGTQRKVYSMFGFDRPAANYSDLSSNLSEVELVIRESVTLPNGSRVNYMPITQLSNIISGGGGLSGNYWESGGDSRTCFGTEIKIGNVLIYETTV